MRISKKILEILKSGKFTLAYHDSNYCCLYEGHKKYDDLEEDMHIAEFGESSFSYIPEEVEVLVKALGGKVVSV